MKADNKSSILPLAWRCESKPEKEELRRALRFMKVGGYEWHYAVYRSHSHSPQEEGYLVQIRIVSRFALRSMFHVLSDEEYSLFPTQKLSIGEFIWHFIEEQERVWGVDMRGLSLAGSNSDKCELKGRRLIYGFMVENAYHGVYRVWSQNGAATKGFDMGINS